MSQETFNVGGGVGPAYENLRQNQVFIVVVAIIGAFFGWTMASMVFPYGLLPAPVETLTETVRIVQSGRGLPNLGITLGRTFVGFIGATIIGIAVGVVMGLNDFGEQFFTPYTFLALSLPGVAWAAVLTIIMGFGHLPAITTVIVTAWPFITIIMWKGVEDIDRDLIKMSQSFGISRRRLLFRMILPDVAPSLFSSFRYGIAISWSIQTNAEIFATSNGIGHHITESFRAHLYTDAFAWALLFLFVIIIIEFGILRPIERRVYRYRRTVDFEVVGE